MANEYASVAELKATLELTGETFADLNLTLALTAASRAIDSMTARRFYLDAAPDRVRYYTPTDTLRVDIEDLVALTEFATDDTGLGAFDTVWTVDTQFFAEPFNAPEKQWPWTRIRVNVQRTSLYLPTQYDRSVRVTGQFGWPAVPEAIKHATLMIAARLVKRAREAPFGVAGFGMDGAAVRISMKDPDIQLLVGPYVRFVIDGVP